MQEEQQCEQENRLVFETEVNKRVVTRHKVKNIKVILSMKYKVYKRFLQGLGLTCRGKGITMVVIPSPPRHNVSQSQEISQGKGEVASSNKHRA